ncbi:tetratricopeptide repeat protein [Mucilaginibacter ginkgonis]|uniref:Tetratricopeptide repeat protein n=1 Tax=Mucilaginibacter ginkgonis TaxID=2682091 RepID=A0A6I4I408_9SPHI|nr:tetratricopeptide repeat protein [Mucilaginibacter ginkgonis]QQL48792.1 tetratricopeptide repeat protein [Mucilaginibacter ginkgonis]
MKFKLLIFLGLLPALSYAQDAASGKLRNAAAKPMTNADSVLMKQLFFTGLRERTIENFALASDLFSHVLQIDPNNDAALYEMANLKKRNNDYDGAQALLERAVAINPNNEWYWVALSTGYEKSNNIARLEAIFSQLIKLNPNNPDYYFDRANALFIGKKYDQSIAVLDSLEKVTGPSDDLLLKRQKVYLAQGNVNKATADIKKAIAENPNQAKYYIMLGEVYNANNFVDDALKAFQKAETLDPSNGYVHLQLADIYRNKKDNDNGFNELKLAFTQAGMSVEQQLHIIMGYVPKFPDANAKASALELSKILTESHPEDSRSFGIYGDMLLQNAQYKAAANAYRRSIAVNDKIYQVHEQLVRIELGDNDFDAAIKDGENALTLFPNQAWMNYLVGVAWLQKKNATKALGYLKTAASSETQDKELLSQTYSAIGDSYHELKDNAKSDAAYDQSITYNPDNGYTLNNYAYYLSVRNEQLDKAAQMAERGNELQPNTASFEDTYAWILFRQKKYAEARPWIEKAIAHDKDKSAVQLEHYGDILFYNGDVDGAVLNWKKAKAGGADSPLLDRKINEKKYIE